MIGPIKIELPFLECKMGSVAFLDIGQLPTMPSGKKLVEASPDDRRSAQLHICTSRKEMLELLL